MAVNLPHNHPRMKRAITAQLEDYAYTHPSFASPKRAEFCRLLAEITPADLDHTYLVSGGSEAGRDRDQAGPPGTDSLGNPTKYKIVSHRDSYHGHDARDPWAWSHNPATQSRFEPMLPKWPGHPAVLGLRPARGDEPRGVGASSAPGRWRPRSTTPAPRRSRRSWPRRTGAARTYACVPPDSYWRTIREICGPPRGADHRRRGRHRVRPYGQVVRHGSLQRRSRHHGQWPRASRAATCPSARVSVSSRINAPLREGLLLRCTVFTFGGHPLGCAAACEGDQHHPGREADRETATNRVLGSSPIATNCSPIRPSPTSGAGA